MVSPTLPIDTGRRSVTWRRGGFGLRLDVRTILVCSLIAASVVVVAVMGLATGDYALTPSQVVAAVFDRTSFEHTVVVGWRMPRVLASVAFGAALGVSGAIFQSLTRNPLASPDIIGFTTGSHTGALVVIVAAGGGYLQTAGGALAGGLATAVVVYVLAYRRGVQGFRLIVVGIAVSAMLLSVNTYLLMVADHDVALAGAVWGAGSLNAISWSQLGLGTAVIAVLLLAAAPLSRPLGQLGLGDEAARATGVRVESARLALIVVGVGLTAAVTAAAGPIAMVALAAPQIALRLTRTPGVAILPAAFTGALILAAADLAGQRLLPGPLPVGIVTVVIGGAYLTWLLVAEARRRA